MSLAQIRCALRTKTKLRFTRIYTPYVTVIAVSLKRGLEDMAVTTETVD